MRPACLHRLWPAVALGSLVVAIGLGGCASDQDSIEKQLSKLHDDVTRLQAETDRMSERMDAMEMRAAAARRDDRVATIEATTVTRPKLKIVRVEPEAEPTAAAASDATDQGENGGRLVIRGEGKELESRTIPAPRPAAKPAPANPKK